MITLTLEQARERCTFWQGVLRLQDWDVEIVILRRSALGHATALGTTTISTYRRARVRLLDPDDFGANDWPIERDMEATLLHELVHLHMHDLGVTEFDRDNRQTAEWTALERTTEAIARALLTCDRREANNVIGGTL